MGFPWVKMLISYIFVFRKQNATRNCNVLFEFLYFGFLDPPTAHSYIQGISKLLPCTLFLASTGLFLLCFDTSSLHLDLMENEYYSKLGTYLDLVIQTAALAGIKPKMMLVGTKAKDLDKCNSGS